MRFAVLVCSGLVLLATTSANARGPGDHGPGNHPNVAGSPRGANGFKPTRPDTGPGSGGRLPALQNTGGDGNAFKPNFADLHPQAASALNNATGNLNTPLGNVPGSGNLPALAHHAGELFSFLEMAKNSSDPQVAARATQILQQFKQLAQECANSSQIGSNMNSATTGNIGSTAGSPPNRINVTHGDSAHAGAHAVGHVNH